MEYRFYSQIEYRKFIRNLSENQKINTLSKPFEMPIILLVFGTKNAYICNAGE